MKNKPQNTQVSVIVPTFNGSRFVADAIRSALLQTCLPLEIVVVDDCSSDETLSIVAQVARCNSIPFRIIRLPENSGGPSRPINVGIEASESELILVLDQDDVLVEDTLDNVMRKFGESDSIACVCHWAAKLGEKEPIQTQQLRGSIKNSTSSSSVDSWIASPCQLLPVLTRFGTFAIGFPGFAFRKAAWKEKGGINENLQIAGDLDFLYWLAKNHNIAIADRVGYFRRVHGDNLSSNRSRRMYEIANVTAQHFLTLDPNTQKSVKSDVLNCLETNLYWLRELGLYRECRRLLRLKRHVDQKKWSELIGLTKLAIFWALRRKRPENPGKDDRNPFHRKTDKNA